MTAMTSRRSRVSRARSRCSSMRPTIAAGTFSCSKIKCDTPGLWTRVVRTVRVQAGSGTLPEGAQWLANQAPRTTRGHASANNTHEVAQSAAPQSRVVYVDNDPIVLTHARALLVSSPEGLISYVEADLRDPGDARPCVAPLQGSDRVIRNR